MYKADIRIDETLLTEDRKLQQSGGVERRSIRKKGYHRALKRDKAWAWSIRAEIVMREISLEMMEIMNSRKSNSKDLAIISLSELINKKEK